MNLNRILFTSNGNKSLFARPLDTISFPVEQVQEGTTFKDWYSTSATSETANHSIASELGPVWISNERKSCPPSSAEHVLNTQINDDFRHLVIEKDFLQHMCSGKLSVVTTEDSSTSLILVHDGDYSAILRTASIEAKKNTQTSDGYIICLFFVGHLHINLSQRPRQEIEWLNVSSTSQITLISST